jgi:hypothetical protein
VKVTRRGRAATVRVNLRGLARLTAKLTIRVTLAGGRTLSTTRTYHPCVHRA